MMVITMARKGHIDETAMLQQLGQVRAERQDVEHELKAARKAAEDVDWVVEAAEWFRQLAAQLPTAKGFCHEKIPNLRVEPTEEEWLELITGVVDCIWVKNDGSLTLEGPFTREVPS